MMDPEEIHQILSEKMPGSEITISEYKPDHFQIMVMWAGFAGKVLIDQHKMVNQALAPQLESGRLHAVKIKTYASPQS